MRRNSGKTPRVPAAAAAAAAGPEDAAAEASEVPLGQPFTDGDDDDSGARASRTDTFPRTDDEIDAEAAAALLTDLEGAAVDEAGDKEEDEDSSNSEEEEDKVAPGLPLATSKTLLANLNPSQERPTKAQTLGLHPQGLPLATS